MIKIELREQEQNWAVGDSREGLKKPCLLDGGSEELNEACMSVMIRPKNNHEKNRWFSWSAMLAVTSNPD